MRSSRYSFNEITSALLGVTGLPLGGAEASDLRKRIESILDEYCTSCHDDADPKADLDLFTLEFDPNNAHNRETWERVFDRVHEHEMPPKEKDQPTDEERDALLSYLKTDLLGIQIPLADQLPADSSGHEFETMAESQQLSHYHLKNYLETADEAVRAARTARSGEPCRPREASPGNRSATWVG